MADEPEVTKAATPAKLDKVIGDSVQSRAHEVNGAWFGVGSPGLNRLLFYRQRSPLDIPPYGYGGRGMALRRVWRLHGADIIASALAVMIQKVQATSYTIEGPQRTVAQAQDMMDLADLGKGWLQFIAKWVIDFCTQDNGVFTELLGPGQPLKRNGVLIRHPDGRPVIDVSQPLEGKPISIAHVDSIACERTGVYEIPVRYYDINGSMHLMHYSRMFFIADMPQPDERLFGYGFCALSRCISMIQYSINWADMRNESLDNMPPLSIMSLENVNKQVYEEQMAAYDADRKAVEERVLRSILTLISQDPTKPVNVKLTPVRQLWDSFDEKKAFDVAVDTVAMAFGLDRQDLAPLTSSAMGSGAQSTVLDEKSRGKGVGNILTQVEGMMRSVMPASCRWHYDRRDDAEELKRATIHETKVRTVVWAFTGSTGKSGGGGGAAAPAPQPIDQTLPGIESPTPASLIDRQQAQRILMYEIPEWADFIDPDMTLRDEVLIDEIDPDVADMQLKMYGPKVRFNSKMRRTVLVEPKRRQTKAAHAVAVEPVSDMEFAEARKRLAAIGIDLDRLRPKQPEASNASA